MNEVQDLYTLNKKELLEKCKNLGIKGVSSKSKQDLIEMLKTKQAKNERNLLRQDEINSIQNSDLKYNEYYIGDNLDLISKLPDESINMIYFDPPYNTGRNFSDFDDKFESTKDYVCFLEKRIKECNRVLKKTGSIIIHVDPTISHRVRIVCDDIFGEKNFRNEIVWQTGGNSKNKYKLNRYHDTLIVYSKTKTQTFNPMYFEYTTEYKKKSNIKFCEIHKKEYTTTAAYNAQPDVNPRFNLRYDWNGNTKQWYVSKEKMETLHNENRLEYNKDGIPRIKRFLDEMDGIPLRDVWCDINNTQLGEKIDYATQKPVKLLERIVKLYSNENDICLDIFAGSGTLGRACANANRKFLLFDINQKGKELFLENIN